MLSNFCLKIIINDETTHFLYQFYKSKTGESLRERGSGNLLINVIFVRFRYRSVSVEYKKGERERGGVAINYYMMEREREWKGEIS